MNEKNIIISFVFAVCWLFRLRNIRNLLRIHQFHGPDWWFNYRVPEGFYQREGQALVRRLRTGLLWPYSIEVPLMVWLWWMDGPLWPMLLMSAFAIVNGIRVTGFLKKLASEGAKYALSEEKPATRIALSLDPRMPRNYVQPWIEWTLRGAIGVTMLLLIYALIRPNHPANPLDLLIPPVITFYVLAGIRIIRGAIADWRVRPIPGVAPELALRWQEAARFQVMQPFEWLRLFGAFFLAGWSLLWVRPESWQWNETARWTLEYPGLLLWLVMCVVLGRSRRRFVAFSKAVRPDGWRPADPPAPEGVFYLFGRLCFRPDEPTMWLRGPHGPALNASHHRARLTVAYLSGWLVLAAGLTAAHFR